MMANSSSNSSWLALDKIIAFATLVVAISGAVLAWQNKNSNFEFTEWQHKFDLCELLQRSQINVVAMENEMLLANKKLKDNDVLSAVKYSEKFHNRIEEIYSSEDIHLKVLPALPREFESQENSFHAMAVDLQDKISNSMWLDKNTNQVMFAEDSEYQDLEIRLESLRKEQAGLTRMCNSREILMWH